MKFNDTKYNMGDEVWGVAEIDTCDKIFCPCCLGKKVVGANERECSECWGRGYITKNERAVDTAVGPFIIEEIGVFVNKDNFYETYYSEWKGNHLEISVDDVFNTEAEAIVKACQKQRKYEEEEKEKAAAISIAEGED